MIDESGFEEFDNSFEQMEKGYSYTQELFYNGSVVKTKI